MYPPIKVATTAGASVLDQDRRPRHEPPKRPERPPRERVAPARNWSAADSSARANTIAVYIVAMSRVAMSSPPHPPTPRPKCQPAASPEMT